MYKHLRIAGLILASILAATALAGDRDTHHRVVIVENGGDEATVTLSGGRIQVISVEDGDSSVHEFDLSVLGGLIDEAVSSAMTGLEAALDDLDEQDLSITVDDDDQIVISHGDRVAAFDLDALAAQLEHTLRNLEIDASWDVDVDHDRRFDEQDEAEQLREELNELKAELDRLRSDLQRVH